MGSSLFEGLGIDIAGMVNTYLGDQFVDATLVKFTPGVYDEDDPAAGSQGTTANYACKVAQTEFIEKVREDDLVRYVEGEIVVILRSVESLQVPKKGDQITLTTPIGTTRTFTIVGDVDIDAAGATATCEVEG